MTIHTIGDSHSCSGWYGVIEHHLGSILCYTFGKEKLNRCDIRNFNIEDGDTIIFCLGEIDCRCHIHKHVNETIVYQDIINNIIDNYFEAIELNVTTSQLKLKNIYIYNIVPPIQIKNTLENPAYPFLGSDEERKTYVLYFNKKLKEKCIEHNFIFFDIYDNYVDKNGFLRKDLSDGAVHIKNGIYINNYVNKNIQRTLRCKIKYGISNNNIDVTQICLSKCIINNILTIPKGDFARSDIFSDPLPNVLKSIFLEYDDRQEITIDLHMT